MISASLATPERFAVIFDRHFATIQSYLRRRIDRSSADDLAAETFTVAFKRRAAYERAHADARPWLYGIAANLLRRERRQERRRLRAYARSGIDPLRDQAATEDRRIEDDSIDPLIARALASLAREEREVLLLFAWEELSYEEIARALRIPMGTVRSRLYRARHRVRELFDAERARRR